MQNPPCPAAPPAYCRDSIDVTAGGLFGWDLALSRGEPLADHAYLGVCDSPGVDEPYTIGLGSPDVVFSFDVQFDMRWRLDLRATRADANLAMYVWAQSCPRFNAEACADDTPRESGGVDRGHAVIDRVFSRGVDSRRYFVIVDGVTAADGQVTPQNAGTLQLAAYAAALHPAGHPRRRRVIGPVAPDRDTFLEAVDAGKNRIPVSRELVWDIETPLAAFLKLGSGPAAFLLESVSDTRKWARYSVVGVKPRRVVTASGSQVGAALSELREALRSARPWRLSDGPRFQGGWVGVFGYDTVRQFERLGCRPPKGPDVPDVHLVETGTFLLFDRLRQTVRVVAVAAPGEPGEEDPAQSWALALGRVDDLLAELRGPLPHLADLDSAPTAVFESNITDSRFREMVDIARDYIRAGDVIQVVISQRLEADRAGVDPTRVYRALRRVNPSPYLFFLRLGADRCLLGASPETLVRVEDGAVEVRPIAGTRPRGGDEAEDLRLEAELLSDPKERAEHLMLLDLGRNDVGRIAEPGTVEVSQSFEVERYSHVMHLVSTVRGRLRKGVDPVDVLRATFPAGTLSGAPKVRAMQIIDELEPVGRGPYGGAVGYLGWDGGLDLCICIRSMLALEDKLYVQAGAGIVHDSDPETERLETLLKAAALRRGTDGL